MARHLHHGGHDFRTRHRYPCDGLQRRRRLDVPAGGGPTLYSPIPDRPGGGPPSGRVGRTLPAMVGRGPLGGRHVPRGRCPDPVVRHSTSPGRQAGSWCGAGRCRGLSKYRYRVSLRACLRGRRLEPDRGGHPRARAPCGTIRETLGRTASRRGRGATALRSDRNYCPLHPRSLDTRTGPLNHLPAKTSKVAVK